MAQSGAIRRLVPFDVVVEALWPMTVVHRSVPDLIRAIRRLPAGSANHDPAARYTANQEQWLGWLGEYDTPGYYRRKAGMTQDARFAYNQLINPGMLLWLATAAGVPARFARDAKRAADAARSKAAAAAAVRRVLPWEVVEAAIWRVTR